jgi:hypothetical protein
MEDGAFYLEDLEDKVELDLSDAVRSFLRFVCVPR